MERREVDANAALPQAADSFEQLGQFVAIACCIAERGDRHLAFAVRALLTGEGGGGGARSHFQHHPIAMVTGLGAPCEAHGLRETHRGTQVCAPVVGRGGLLLLHPRGGHRADDGDTGSVERHAFHYASIGLHDGVHHGAMEGMAGHQQLAGDALGLQFGL